jgi:cytidylate kinase
MSNFYKIAVDGPSGSGKSSLAKGIAKTLGIIYVDTGALYRTIGLAAYRAGIDPKDADAVAVLLPEIKLELAFDNGLQHVLLDGEDVGESIRTPEMSMYASSVSAHPGVRAFLLDTQRDIAKTTSVVMDGRDIGSVIFPVAEVKFFLCAADEVRAERRFAELTEKGIDTTYEAVLADIITRDRNDSTREVAPAVKAEDAVILDNSGFMPEDTLAAALKIIETKLGGIAEPQSDEPQPIILTEPKTDEANGDALAEPKSGVGKPRIIPVPGNAVEKPRPAAEQKKAEAQPIIPEAPIVGEGKPPVGAEPDTVAQPHITAQPAVHAKKAERDAAVPDPQKKLKFYSFLQFLFGGFCKLLMRVKITGIENIPKEGAVLLCSNHISRWDDILLFCLIPRQIRFMAKIELFRAPVVGPLLKALGAFKIDRGNSDVASIRKAIMILKEGNQLCVHPQGRRYIGVPPYGTPVHAGIGMMICRGRAAAVPISIETKGWKAKLFRRVYMRIGKPIEYDSWGLQEKPTMEDYKYVTDEVFARICDGLTMDK